MFYYVQSLTDANGLTFSPEILKNMIELYTDIVLMFTVKGQVIVIGGTPS